MWPLVAVALLGVLAGCLAVQQGGDQARVSLDLLALHE